MNQTKKRILIVMPGPMELGGVERSLLGLLDSIDYAQYEVDLFLYGHHGPLFCQIPEPVHLLPEVKELAYLRDSLRQKLTHRCFLSAALRLKDAVLQKLGRPVSFDRTWATITHLCAPRLNTQYDLALSFFLPFDYLEEKVDAKVKLGWIHTDYSSENTDEDMLLEQYSKVDYIIAVSRKCADTFAHRLPQLQSRIRVIENILPEKLIRQQAEAFSADAEMPRKGIRLLSVGRYCTAKNFDNVPDICARLVQSGLDVYWYIIGFGSDEALIRQKIRESHMEDRVILLGKKENPYPYIRACDLYVQPSRYEGKCVTVREAQILEKPVVITRYATSASQLEENVDGIIVPMDNEGCAAGIARLLQSPAELERLSAHCQTHNYSNAAEINKLTALVREL